jgi:hypothetical protein
MGIEITFPILVLFCSSILALLVLSFASKKISGGFIPALAVIAGGLWIALFSNIDKVSGMELNGNVTISESPLTTDYMNQQTGVSTSSLGAGETNILAGENIVNSGSLLYGKEINQITLRLDKDGIPPNDAYVGIWNGVVNPTSTNYKFLIAQFKANNTNLSVMDYTFTRNDTRTYVLDSDDIVGIFYNSGTAGNRINVSFNGTANSFDNSDSQYSRFQRTTNTWVDSSASDLRGKISLAVNNIEERSEPIDFNDGATKIYMVAIGVLFMVLGAMQRLDKD